MAKQKQFKAEWVNAVVMDVKKTGKLLALADSTSMDNNRGNRPHVPPLHHHAGL